VEVAGFSLCGATLLGLGGWFLRRLVDQIDSRATENTNELRALGIHINNLRDRLETLRQDLKAHEAAHMASGHRLDRRDD
jgi:hypothetical protein